MTRRYTKRKGRVIPVESGSFLDLVEKNERKAKRNFEENLY
jgi:hypothetical protein